MQGSLVRANLAYSGLRISCMRTSMTSPRQLPAWPALEAHYRTIRDVHLRTLFGEDPRRGERLTAEAAGLYLDYSKNRLTDETMRLLLDLAERPACATGSTRCSAARRSM